MHTTEQAQPDRPDASPARPPPNRGQRLLRWFQALGLLSLLGTAGYLASLWEPYWFPVRTVTVDGEVKRLSPRRLRETVSTHMNGGILTQDLFALKTAVEAMPWVRSASLRRHWPDRLQIEVVEQVAFAQWGEDALVSPEAVVFRPAEGSLPAGLPVLNAEERQAALLVDSLRRWTRALEGHGLAIREITLTDRGAWTLEFAEGFALELGKTRVAERFARFLRVYGQVSEVGAPAVLDMRYSNGLAIRWADPAELDSRDGHPDARDKTSGSKLTSRPAGSSRS